jgi:hypothetical protein
MHFNRKGNRGQKRNLQTKILTPITPYMGLSMENGIGLLITIRPQIYNVLILVLIGGGGGFF